MYYVYVIQSQRDKKFYTGFTGDLQNRFQEHNAGRVYSTKKRGPFELIYYEACLSVYSADSGHLFRWKAATCSD